MFSQDLAGAFDEGDRKSGELGDFDSVTLGGWAGFGLSEEYDSDSALLDRNV